MLAVSAIAFFLTTAAGEAAQANGTGITVPDEGTANPFPSTIAVSGSVGTIQKVAVTLTRVTHTCPIDLDIQLVSPSGTRVMLASDAGARPGGGCPDARDVDLVFDDQARRRLPDTRLRSGSYRPANYPEDDPAFCGPEEGGPAPDLTGGTELAAFAGEDPRGVWSLFVVDDCVDDGGSIAGWSLDIQSTGIAVADTTPPRISMLAAAPQCERVGNGSPGGAGITVSYLLSEDATVTYDVARRVASQRRSECPFRTVAGPPGTYRSVGTLTEPTPGGVVQRGLVSAAAATRTTMTVRAGHRAVSLATLIQGARLERGTYLVTVLARDGAGNRSALARVKFWVLPGSAAQARSGRVSADASQAPDRKNSRR